MLTQDRAIEVKAKASHWPYWGNYHQFMTPDEIDHVSYIFQHAKSGHVSTGSIVNAIAMGYPMYELRDGVPSYEDVVNQQQT